MKTVSIRDAEILVYFGDYASLTSHYTDFGISSELLAHFGDLL